MSEAYSKELICKADEIAKEKESKYNTEYILAHKVLLSKLLPNINYSISLAPTLLVCLPFRK